MQIADVKRTYKSSQDDNINYTPHGQSERGEGGRAPEGRRKSYLERCHVPLPRKGGTGAAVKKLLQNEERTRLSPYYTNMSTETEARLRELALTAAGGQGPEIRQPSQSLFFGMSAAVPCFCPSDPSGCT